jgi:hypothetical protein
MKLITEYLERTVNLESRGGRAGRQLQERVVKSSGGVSEARG